MTQAANPRTSTVVRDDRGGTAGNTRADITGTAQHAPRGADESGEFPLSDAVARGTPGLSAAAPVLDISSLTLEFPIFKGVVKALNGVNLQVRQGEIVGLVGESGSGKSVTAMAILRLLQQDAFRVKAGSITVLGRDVFALSEPELLAMRGRDVAMIFQEPMTALNPTRRVGRQLVDVIRRHQPVSPAKALEQAERLLRDMYIGDPVDVLNRYPFELSGGMRQRIMIALAFSCNPSLLIADEPTTALDVTVQRQVLLLLREKARALGTAVLFITHDMAVVSQFCDRVYVMYAGSVVEQSPTGPLIESPAHPYTRALLRGLPENALPRTELPAIPGHAPDLSALPEGCPFRDRCSFADEQCRQKPLLEPMPGVPGRAYACWHPTLSARVGQGD